MISEKGSLRLVVDTNRIIAALVRDSTSRWIITHLDAEMYTIRVSENEIVKHKSLILEKSGLSVMEFERVFEKLMERMIILEDNLVLTMMEKAKVIMDKIDPDDTPFIAAALAVKADIWSDDKHFEKQRKVKIWNTPDLMKIL